MEDPETSARLLAVRWWASGRGERDSPRVGSVPEDGVAVGVHFGARLLAENTHPQRQAHERDHFHLQHRYGETSGRTTRARRTVIPLRFQSLTVSFGDAGFQLAVDGRERPSLVHMWLRVFIAARVSSLKNKTNTNALTTYIDGAEWTAIQRCS